jgi:hypothetical protein
MIRYTVESPHYREDYYNSWVTEDNNKLVKGIIGKVSRKDFQGKTLTSFALKGQDGWYSVGERSLQFNEGDSVQFNVETRGKYAYAKDLTPWTDGGATSAPAVPSGPRFTPKSNKSFGANAAKDKYWEDKEKRDLERERYQREVTQPRIEVQAARNAAIQTASFMFEKELVKVPAKQADKYDAFIELIETLTDEFVKRNSARVPGNEKPQTPEDPEVFDDEVSVDSEDQGAW